MDKKFIYFSQIKILRIFHSYFRYEKYKYINMYCSLIKWLDMTPNMIIQNLLKKNQTLSDSGCCNKIDWKLAASLDYNRLLFHSYQLWKKNVPRICTHDTRKSKMQREFSQKWLVFIISKHSQNSKVKNVTKKTQHFCSIGAKKVQELYKAVLISDKK